MVKRVNTPFLGGKKTCNKTIRKSRGKIKVMIYNCRILHIYIGYWGWQPGLLPYHFTG